MVLGDKLFEKSGNIIGLKITRVNPIEGVTTEVTFTSEIRRQAGIQAAKTLEQGTMTKYLHGMMDTTWQGSLMIAEGGNWI